MLLLFSGSYDELLDYVIFAVLGFYALTVAGLFVLRRTQPAIPRPFRVPGYPWTPLAFIIAALALVINTASTPQSIADSFEIRRSALTHQVPHYTTIAGARAAVHAIAALKTGTLEVAPLQSYFRGSF